MGCEPCPRQELAFFWNLPLGKSQADALLNQLASHWEQDFEALCHLLAVSAVVHADETGWSVRSVWAFLSEKVRVIIHGCHKDGATLAQLLDKDTFQGALVSDDAAVYQGFTLAQKCWAHLLRKAIRLSLQYPDNQEYCAFLDELLSVYQRAKQIAAKRMSKADRDVCVEALTDSLAAACVSRSDEKFDEVATEEEREFTNLVREVNRLLWAGELFTFVTHPGVDGTNNEAERSLRPTALDRRTGRTNKTVRGARRRTVLVSMLESIKLHLPEFHLAAVLEEVSSWLSAGESRFTRMLRQTGLDPPENSRLNSRLNSLIPDL